MAGMAQAGKEVLVEALVAEPADEALDEPVSRMGLPAAR